MPKSTFVEIPEEEQAQMLAALRRARYGYLLSLHILLLCAARRNPTDIADVLFCSRSSVYRTVRAYRAGILGWEPDDDGRLRLPVRATVLVPTLRRSLLALLKALPRAYGWCCTRWSGATLADTLRTKRGLGVSAETMRRWVHEVGWVWKRAKLVAKDDDPQRVERLARIRYVYEPLRLWEAMVFADELDIPYRAVDKHGQTIDFLLTENRDTEAALRFLEKAIRRNGVPETITIDGSDANEAAIKRYNEEHGTTIHIRQVKYLNNIVEQDHRAVKRITRPMLGFKAFDTAQDTLVGIELMHMLRKRQLMMEAGNESLTAAKQFYSLAA